MNKYMCWNHSKIIYLNYNIYNIKLLIINMNLFINSSSIGWEDD